MRFTVALLVLLSLGVSARYQYSPGQPGQPGQPGHPGYQEYNGYYYGYGQGGRGGDDVRMSLWISTGSIRRFGSCRMEWTLHIA
ncbi:hypothetical protein QR680_003902 [Steinernema hermaphroditum]|uniref:Uncharacterized protein n=1 Tax=Steinernema hermaphroditum TaxID=289476 RepID=A0AA39HM05_9BILA|nr:hypothetical protein QR680_003902 [Steinernema hermaphroditum]